MTARRFFLLTPFMPILTGGRTRLQAVPMFLLLCISLLLAGGCAATREPSPSEGIPSLPVTEPSPPPTPSVPQGQTGAGGLLSRIPVPGLTGEKGGVPSNPQYATEEDLLKVIAEFQQLATRDTYRFPVPKDVTGANVYKATLRRLQDYEDKHPGAYPEILAFTRGRTYEGLHEYEKAITQYQLVSQGKHRLSAEATKAVEALSRFQHLKQEPVSATTPLEYLQALDRKIAAWQELQRQYPGTIYTVLAREEEEAVDYMKVAFLLLNRHRFEDGNESVALAYDQLITKHKDSKNAYRYQLEFGDFYFALAQEYVAQNGPETLQFDASTFEDVGRTALRLYAQVAQEDGVMEKLEAKGKLEALEAYMARVGRLGR